MAARKRKNADPREGLKATKFKKKEQRERKVFRQKERARDRERKKTWREDDDNLKNEQARDIQRKKAWREEDGNRKNERQSDNQYRKTWREEAVNLKKEQTNDVQRKKTWREEDDNRKNERQIDNQYRKTWREEAVNLKKEQTIDVQRKKTWREEVDNRQKEQARDVSRKQTLRENSEITDLLIFTQWDSLLDKYRTHIKDGPTHMCSSCGGLWFAKSIHSVSKDVLIKQGYNFEFVQTLLQKTALAGGYQLCGTCHNSMRGRKIPTRNLSNGFGFPELPPSITDLTELEQRLVSPRLPFMQIRPLGIELQKGLRGNIVNVPNDLDVCSKVLPRKMNESATIQVKLMRKMIYKHHYLYETVRPAAVYEAAKELCNSELYKKERIVLSNEWKREYLADRVDFRVNAVTENESVGTTTNLEDPTNEFESDEDEEQEHLGASETMILADENAVVKIAPAEGQRPIGILRDIHAQQLSFPAIYGGVQRKFKEGLKISMSTIANSEVRMYDRRAVKPTHLLYLAKLIQNRQVADQIQVCLRKKKGLNQFTAADIRSESKLENLISHDDGYRFLRGVRSSPAFWQNQQKKVLALIRQTRLPTFFMTLSAAETKWAELLVSLKQIYTNTSISAEEAMKLSFQQKARLIQNDPATCALYFDYKFRALLNFLINKPNGAFAPYLVTDHFAKTEFQQRGSPHEHLMIWIKNAPEYNPDDPESIKACIRFIDLFITCSRTGDKELEELIMYQFHKHSHACKQKCAGGGFKCRFNYPLPPMPSTTILTPLRSDDPNYNSSKSAFDRIHKTLNEMGRTFIEDIPFNVFLEQLGLTNDEYIMAVRSSITRDKVFLKRRTCDIFVNAYNEKLLKAWKANMDLQFILDPYACVKYCVTYLTKSFGGISKLMRDVETDIRNGNYSLQEKLRVISNKFLNAVEISAQEAVYLILGLNLTNCSRDDVFINTGPPEERVELLKPLEDLKELPGESKEITVKGLIDHYVQRPQELENLCLADFAARWTYCKSTSKKAALPLQDGSGFVIPRMKERIIRYRRYKNDQDSANYCREQLMLYVPWRNEQAELIDCSLCTKLNGLSETVSKNRDLYDPHHSDKSLEDLVSIVETDINDHFTQKSDEPSDEDYETDILDSITNSKQVRKFDFLMPPKQIPDGEFWDMYRKLNHGQRAYFIHLVHCIKIKKRQVFDFVSGGAGVGKSHLITVIVQWLLRFATKLPGFNLESLPVIIGAPTGKASFNVFGMTLHCLFRLPPNERRNENLAKLPEDVCNSLRVKYQNLMLIIIDEISMVSSTKFSEVNQRLQQLFQTKELFGGIPILVVGDFYQIRPVMGKFVFEVDRGAPFGAILGNHLWAPFKMYELSQIMRQDKALEFAVALNNIAKGTMTDSDIAMIKSREIQNGLTIPNEALHLFHENKDCAQFNQSLHESLRTEWAISEAYDKVQGVKSVEEEENFLRYVKTLTTAETDGLPNTLRLQIGAQYMISTNVNVADGLFNGSTGELMHISYGENSIGERVPTTVYLRFENPVVGAETRSANPNLILDKSWTPIRMVTKPLNKIGYNQGFTVMRRQFPLMSANAITITKSQGSSIKYVVLHIRRRLRRDLLYVALSRAFSPDGLFIDGTFVPPGPPPQYLTLEMERLRRDPLRLAVERHQFTSNEFYTLTYHNVQSLHKHIFDIACDPVYMQADALAFVEPWTLGSDFYYDLGGFIFQQRQDCQGIRSSYGSFLASRLEFTNYIFKYYKSGVSSHYSFTMWRIGQVQFCLVYRSPSSIIRDFIEHLEDLVKSFEENFQIIFGDFNLDLLKDHSLIKLFNQLGLRLAVPAYSVSTDGGTQIDLCFSNIQGVRADYYESIFSYHKPILITCPNANYQELSKIDKSDGIENLGCQKSTEQQQQPNTVEHQESVTGLSLNEVPTSEEPMEMDGIDLNHVDVDNSWLPTVTYENARARHLLVHGISLSLIDLKSLSNDQDQSEIEILANVAVEDKEIENIEHFNPKFLTDNIILACINMYLAGTTSIIVPPSAVEASLRDKDYCFGVEPGKWGSNDYIFLPVHQGTNHWTLLIAQPDKRNCLYLDPAVALPEELPSQIKKLLPQIRSILDVGDIELLQPPKCLQKDAYNCGLYIIKYVEKTITGESFVSCFDTKEYRQHLLQSLWMANELI